MGLLDDGTTALSGFFRDTEDVSGTYTLKGTAYGITISATPAAFSLELEPGVFTTQRTQNKDYIFRREDLVFYGRQHTPEPGDEFVEVDAEGETWTYEVMEVPGEGAWRWHDELRHSYRVHFTLTKKGL